MPSDLLIKGYIYDLSKVSIDSDDHEMLDMLMRVESFHKKVTELHKSAKEAMTDWIKANGDIQYQDGDGETIRYYVAPKKTTKLREGKKAAAIMAILEATGGDLDSLAELLASQPVKHGAVKKVILEATFNELFETVITTDLKTGKPKPELQTLNTRFLKG